MGPDGGDGAAIVGGGDAARGALAVGAEGFGPVEEASVGEVIAFEASSGPGFALAYHRAPVWSYKKGWRWKMADGFHPPNPVLGELGFLRFFLFSFETSERRRERDQIKAKALGV